MSNLTFGKKEYCPVARYYQNHFKAGLLYEGRDNGEELWYGGREQWDKLEILNEEYGM